MRISSKIGLLSILVAVLFALSMLWVPSAAAKPASSTQDQARYAQSKHKKNLKKTVRAKRGKARRAQVAAVQTSPTTICYSGCPQNWNTPGYTWNTAATYGAGSVQTQPQPAAVSTQAVAPQNQVSQAPATVCYNYNPCTSCWTVPTYTWSVPATSGNTPRTVLQRILPPLPRPGAPQGLATQAQAQPQPQAIAPQASTAQTTTVCSSVAPSWWPSWASLCR